MPKFENMHDLVIHLEATGALIWGGIPTAGTIPFDQVDDGWKLQVGEVYEGDPLLTTENMGLQQIPSDIVVSAQLRSDIEAALVDEQSSVRLHSVWPVTRSFVYVDISDFSRFGGGAQLAVVASLVRLVTTKANWLGDATAMYLGAKIEAQLCIGDGYIYVLHDAVDAAYFAAFLARLIETRVADKAVPEFHFRMGVHVGKVLRFEDPGRKTWNYVGPGINGGQRVLSAIGKETDDVVFISSNVRTQIQATKSHPAKVRLMTSMENKGRRADKHGKLWRVYQLNHFSALLPVTG